MERADNDTRAESWDLATSVGATATMVAAGRARATNAALIDDPLAEPLVRAVGIDFFTRWATGELDAAAVDIPGAPWGMQQMTDLLTARTRYFDAFLLDAANAGIHQAVLLASGLDARGYRLPWPSGTVIYENDQPEVLSFKAATLADLQVVPTAEVRTAPADLRDDWPAALRKAGFDADRPSAWIAEGLLPFLPADAQDHLLDHISALSADGSRLAVEVGLNSDSADSDQAREAMEQVTQRWRDNGFDIEFGELGYPGERNDVVTYLAERGWSSTCTPLRKLLSDAGLAAPSLATDGRATVAAENYYCTAVKP